MDWRKPGFLVTQILYHSIRVRVTRLPFIMMIRRPISICHGTSPCPRKSRRMKSDLSQGRVLRLVCERDFDLIKKISQIVLLNPWICWSYFP